MPDLTLTAPTLTLPSPEIPTGITIRPLSLADADVLARLYVRSYPPAVIDGMDEATALADMRQTFAGAYGTIEPAATLGACIDDRPVAAVMTVADAPWPDTPPGPFVIEVFTDPPYRRRGLARALLLTAMHAVTPAPVSLRVDASNTAARDLYRSLGFVSSS